MVCDVWYGNAIITRVVTFSTRHDGMPGEIRSWVDEDVPTGRPAGGPPFVVSQVLPKCAGNRRQLQSSVWLSPPSFYSLLLPIIQIFGHESIIFVSFTITPLGDFSPPRVVGDAALALWSPF